MPSGAVTSPKPLEPPLERTVAEAAPATPYLQLLESDTVVIKGVEVGEDQVALHLPRILHPQMAWTREPRPYRGRGRPRWGAECVPSNTGIWLAFSLMQS